MSSKKLHLAGGLLKSIQQQFTYAFFVVLFMLNISKAYAASITASANGNWSATTTWVGGVVPGSGDDVTIPAGITVTLIDNRLCNSLTINATNLGGNGQLTANTHNLTVTTNITLNSSSLYSGTILFTSGTLTFSGTGTFTNNGIFTSGTGTTTFNGSTTLSGTGGFTFNIIIIGGTLTSLSAGTVYLNGNFTNNGTFNHNNGTIDFNGTSTIGGSSTTTFYNFTYENASTVNMPLGNVNVANNFTSNLNTSGAFNHGNGTITLTNTGATTLSVFNSSYAPDFYNLVQSGSGTTTLGGSIKISNMFTISAGTFNTTVFYDVINGSNPGPGKFTMTGGKFGEGYGGAGVTEPALTGAYSLTGGTVSFEQNNSDRVIRAGTYYNIEINSFASSQKATLGGNITTSGYLKMLNGYIDVTATPYNITVAGDWTDNTSSSYPFLGRTGTVTFNGSSAQTISGTDSTAFYNLTINKTPSASNTLTTSSNISVSNTLTLTNGVIVSDRSGSNYITMLRGSSVSPTAGGNANCFVKGQIRKVGNTSFTYPVGDINGSTLIWAPIAAAPVSGTAFTDKFNGQYYYSVPPNRTATAAGVNHVSLVEYWDLARINGGGTWDVTLMSKDSTKSGITNSGNCCSSNDLLFVHYNNPGGGLKWYKETNTFSISKPGGKEVDVTVRLATYSPLTFGGNVNALPIELLNFTAIKSRGSVVLNWATASEMNNANYTIERSVDGISFNAITKINGVGNSNVVHKYTYTDVEPPLGMALYYRLKQSDFDGEYKYSEVVSVNIPASVSFNLSASPNLVDEVVSFTGNIKLENATIKIYDLRGQMVLEKILTDINHIDVSMLSKGVYMATIVTQDGIVGKTKFFKQ